MCPKPTWLSSVALFTLTWQHPGLVQGSLLLWSSSRPPNKRGRHTFPLLPTAPQSRREGFSSHLPLVTILVCLGCRDKVPQTGGLRIRNVLSPSFGGWSLRARCRQAWFLLRAVREDSVPHLSSWLVEGHLYVRMAICPCSCLCPSFPFL